MRDPDLYELLEQVTEKVEDQNELAARRLADSRHLVIERHCPEHLIDSDDEFLLHLIVPRTWQCIAVRSNWPNMRKLLTYLTPRGLKNLIERARPCALHPPPSASDRTAESDARE
jgi:hypothetical protein